jgi:CheY-like chemotaxis protein
LARKILLADDSVTAQNMGRKILADAGYDVTTVNNGSAALKRIAELKPDLIVLDVYMPGYSGLEVCQRLKDSGETAHIPVLLTVGKLEPFKPEEARRVRADAHIVKPFEASELLTAVTRLEDLMVARPSEGARPGAVDSGTERFRSAGSGRKSESNSEADTGWKSRLGFPSKKKKEEKEEVVEDAAVGTFRDFRKGKRKSAGGVNTGKQASGQEQGLVPDIPRDITPEELDALSALAAKLDGPISSGEKVAPLVDEGAEQTAQETAPETTVGSVEAPSVEVADAGAAVEILAATPEEKAEEKREEQTEVETAAPAVASAAPMVARPVVEAPIPEAPIAEVPVFAVEGKSEIEIPVEHVELATEAVTAVATGIVIADPAAAEIDRGSIEPAAVEPVTNQPSENQPSETPAAVVAATVNTALLAEEPACVDRDDEPMFASAASAEEQAAEEQAAEEPAPSDAELVQALRLLTPASWHADFSTVPSRGTLVASQLLAEEAARNAEASPRWVAEPVALSPEEAAISLEAEMFRTFAAMPAGMPAPGEAMEAVRITGVSAIAAAVESRLAAAEAAGSAETLLEPLPEPGAERLSGEHDSAQHDAEAAAAEKSVAEATSEAMETVSNEEAPSAAGIEAEKVAAEKLEADQEVSSATFADAIGQGEVETAPEPVGEYVSGTEHTTATVATAEEDQDSSLDSGGQESMGKKVKPKAEKLDLPAIGTAPARAAAQSDVVEAAKSPEYETKEALKAMAAAAAEGSASPSRAASATDASTIASIVDSVLADLRPKLVEEIARKLAGK